MFKQLTPNIYKPEIPFDNITTAAFLIKTQKGDILIDCGTTPHDVTEIIMPALLNLNTKVEFLFLTHNHGDHTGGADTLLKALPHVTLLTFDKGTAKSRPNARLLVNKDRILEDVICLSLPGHSHDSGALLDRRTDSLITGDSLQLWGIDKYGCGICSPKEYLKSIARLKVLSPNNLFTSHEYYPLGSEAVGKENVANYLKTCEEFIISVGEFIDARQNAGITDPAEITALYMDEKLKLYPNMPKMPIGTITAIKNFLKDNLN